MSGPPERAQVRRVLLLRWSAMGDIALASAGFEAVCRAFPEAEVDLDVLPPWPALFEDDPRFRHILGLPLRVRSRWRQLVASMRWLARVRAARYDVLVDLQSTDRSRIMIAALWLVGARVRYRVGNRRVFPYNLAPPPVAEPVHALTRIRRALSAAGIPCEVDRPHLHVPPHLLEAAQRKLSRLALQPGSYAVFLPGSQRAGHLKRWGAARYARLAELLQAHGIRDVLILGGPDEVEECAAIAAGSDARVHDLCGQTALQEIVPLCQGARLVVANDTGTAHVAAVADRPMLVLCGPTDPRKVLPAGAQVVGLQAELACINCYRKDCAHHSCMHVMTPQRVAHVLATQAPFASPAPPSADGSA